MKIKRYNNFKKVAVYLGAGLLVLNMNRIPAIRPEKFELKKEIVSFNKKNGMKKTLKPNNKGMSNYYYGNRGAVRHN